MHLSLSPCYTSEENSENTSRSALRSLEVSYQLLVEFSKRLDTAKRAVDALHWAVFKSEEFGDVLKITDRADDDAECSGEVISTLQDSGMASFFAAYPWDWSFGILKEVGRRTTLH